MKIKKVTLIILLFVTTMSLFGCSNELGNELELNNPPTLKVSYENKSIDAEMGISSWTITNSDGTNTSTESDTEGPIELVKDTNPLKVSPASTIKLDFSNEPKEVMVNIWEEDKQLEQPLTGMELITPKMGGLVIYEVIATWEQGIVHYAFLINVE